jgi:hypothetical protein
MPENEVTPKLERTIEYRQPAEGMFRTYSNNVALAATSFDLKFLFGEVAEFQADKVVIEHRAQITMTWLEAKILSDFLQANIKSYEELNGPLKLPTIQGTLIVPDTFPKKPPSPVTQ